MSSEAIVQNYFDDSLSAFRAYKKLAEKAIAQMKDEELFLTLDEESNSVAVIMKHMAGNMLSRWTNFLTTDGEKPDRNRDMEFVIESQTTKEDVLAYWERGWECVFNALQPLKPEDFEKTVVIRSEKHTIVQAINRQLMHYSYHIGQIVFLAKHYRSTAWNSLSIPRNRSGEFNSFLSTRGGDADREQQFDAAAGFSPKRREQVIRAQIHHVNVTVAPELEAAAKHFYGVVMNLQEVPKPESSRGRGGAWYQLGPLQLHLSIEKSSGENCVSKRHVCYTVADLAEAEERFRNAGVEILPDDLPTPGWSRFYVRDPGGNKLEIARAV